MNTLIDSAFADRIEAMHEIYRSKMTPTTPPMKTLSATPAKPPGAPREQFYDIRRRIVIKPDGEERPMTRQEFDRWANGKHFPEAPLTRSQVSAHKQYGLVSWS